MARPFFAARLEEKLNSFIGSVLRRRGWRESIIPYTGYGTTDFVRVMARLVLVPVFVWLLMRRAGFDDDGRPTADYLPDRWWATVVFVVATITDWVDGDLARRRGLITAFGKLMDPIADKALIGTALIALSLIDQGWDPARTEAELHARGLHPALAHDAVTWAAAHHQRGLGAPDLAPPAA